MGTSATEKIQNVTQKGQITLPIAWRRKTGAGQIIVRVKGDVLEIAPARVSAAAPKEYTVFDALRDNKGKGIKASDLLKLLRKMNA